MQAVGASTLVGRVVDGAYRIDALLGQGAAGTVYRAIEQSSGRVLALKQWHRSGLDDQVRGRFLREAKALDTLDHRNIVKVFAHGFVDDVPYVVLEYLEGRTLESLLTAGQPLPTGVAFDVAGQALSAIAYAHERNVVHRDIKPENIFLTPGPGGGHVVKILDYGLAKFMSPTEDPTKDVALTMTGMVIGTPLYMPPEQAAGSSVDLPVDVYAMGCVLFEMLTGRPPFLGESHMELLAAHLHASIPRITSYRPGVRVARELQALMDNALAKKQTERFPDAGAMLRALQAIPQPAIVEGEPVSEPAPKLADTAEPAPPRQERARGASLLPWTLALVMAAAGALAFALLR